MALTERLFWQDPYQQSFDARVIRRLEWEGRPAVVLDATCFYPTSGGQPHDTGQLNHVRVLDVVEHGDEIVHVLEAPLTEDRVEGRIDWARRLDHMQQHAGQHILSGAFAQTVGAHTVSFHLGPAASTIDLDCNELSTQAFDETEEMANRIVVEGHPIQVSQHDEVALQSVPLRKAPQVEGLVRVVSIPEFDYSACGGTHPHTSGEVGLIHIERWERHQGQLRVTFLCGLRAVRDYRHKSRLGRDLAAHYSVALDELPAALERMEIAADDARRAEARLRTRLLDLQTAVLSDTAEQVGNRRIVCHYLKDTDAAGMRQIAQQLIQQSGMVVALGVTNPSPQFCLARSPDVELDMVAMASELAGPYGGRGGGRTHMAQGGGLSHDDLLAMLNDARARLAS